MESNNKKESEIEEEMVNNLEKETKELKDQMKEIKQLLKVFLIEVSIIFMQTFVGALVF